MEKTITRHLNGNFITDNNLLKIIKEEKSFENLQMKEYFNLEESNLKNKDLYLSNINYDEDNNKILNNEGKSKNKSFKNINLINVNNSLINFSNEVSSFYNNSKIDIKNIYNDFYKSKNSNEYGYDLLLENNFVDPSLIYGIYYSSFRLDIAFKTELNRFIILGSQESKINDFMNCLIKDFDKFFCIENNNLKNIFLIIKFIDDKKDQKILKNKTIKNSKSINDFCILKSKSDDISLEKYNDFIIEDINFPNIEENIKEDEKSNFDQLKNPKLFSCKIVQDCGIKFEKKELLAEKIDSIVEELKKFDKNLNYHELELIKKNKYDEYNINYRDELIKKNEIIETFDFNNNRCNYSDETKLISERSFEIDDLDYFKSKSCLEMLEQLCFVLQIPVSNLKLDAIEIDKIKNLEFLMLPTINTENVINNKVFNKCKKNSNLPINHYKFLKQFLNYDNQLINNYIENKKTETKLKINKKLFKKQEWQEDAYFRNNLEKKRHKKNTIINLISCKNIFSENLKNIFVDFCKEEKIQNDLLIGNYFIIDDIEYISNNEILKFSNSEFFQQIFIEEIDKNKSNNKENMDNSLYKNSNSIIETEKNLIDSNFLIKKNSTNMEIIYLESLKIISFLKEVNNNLRNNTNFRKDSIFRSENKLNKQNIIKLNDDNKNVSKDEQKINNKNHLNSKKITDLQQRFINNFIKKFYSNIFNLADKNQKIFFYSSYYTLIKQEFDTILNKIESQENTTLELEEENFCLLEFKDIIQQREKYVQNSLLTKNQDDMNEYLMNEKFTIDNKNINFNEDSLNIVKNSFEKMNNNEENLKIRTSDSNFDIQLDKNLNLNNEIFYNKLFDKIYFKNSENQNYNNFQDFKNFKKKLLLNNCSQFNKYFEEFAKSITDLINKNNYFQSEILHFYSNYQRYSTIINDLLSVYTNNHYDYIISNKQEMEKTLHLYNVIIRLKKSEFDWEITGFKENFLEELDEYYKQKKIEMTIFKDSINIFTKSKLNQIEGKFKKIIEELKIKIDNYVNEISERNIILILNIIKELKDKGYLNEFISNYLINIQSLINLNNIDFDYYYENIAKEILLRLGISSGVGIACGAIGFGLSRVISVITADAISGSFAGPVGTIAGTALGLITLVGSGYKYFKENKSKFCQKFDEIENKMDLFYKILKERLEQFFSNNNKEINDRLKKLISYIEFTIGKYLQMNNII